MTPAPYLTVQQVAELAQVDKKTVRRAIHAGRLQAFKIGTLIRIREQDALYWIERRPIRAVKTSPARPVRPRARPRRQATGSVAILKGMDNGVHQPRVG